MSRYALLAVLLAGPAAAVPSVWIIGGGAGIEHSQIQIESNVRWLESGLLERGIDVGTYFALGDDPGKDIAYFDRERADRAAGTLAPLARVFGDPIDAGLAFRRHALQAVRGSTRKAEMLARLRAEFESHDPARDALVVYNGHGGLDEADTSRNYLRLWDEERLDVAELAGLLGALPDGTTTRFVMTQCYSGAFHSLIYESAPEPGRVSGKRCGFMSESALEQAEGCALDVEAAEYRDYSTYFFAALTGTTRLGEAVPAAVVDRDGDGRVSYREAHFHTLATAHNADLPRATSEAYLEAWTPWYVQWDAGFDGRSSVYWTLAEQVADRYGWSAAPDALETRRRELLAVDADVNGRRRAGRDRVAALADALQTELVTRWPGLAYPYSPAYAELIETALPAIVDYLDGDSRYAELVAEQTQLDTLGRELTDVRRHLTQIDKIHRLRRLAQLEAALAVHGNARERGEYAGLVECESGGLED